MKFAWSAGLPTLETMELLLASGNPDARDMLTNLTETNPIIAQVSFIDQLRCSQKGLMGHDTIACAPY